MWQYISIYSRRNKNRSRNKDSHRGITENNGIARHGVGQINEKTGKGGGGARYLFIFFVVVAWRPCVGRARRNPACQRQAYHTLYALREALDPKQ